MNEHDELQNQHESPSFLKSALALRGSVTPKVMGKVLFIVIYTALVTYFCQIYPNAILPVGPFEYGGLIMGLILVFRINAGHDRWWEARKLWGNVVNQSRNLAIITINGIQQDTQDWIVKMTNLIKILPYLMKDNLRGNTDLQYIIHLIDANHTAALTKANHRPIIIASMMSQQLQIARHQHGLDSFAFLLAQQNIEHLMDSQGACERILKTPMPFVMAIKARRFILFFLLMLPFALAHVSYYMSPVIAGLISYALLSLDQIGIELQNPFSETNLSHLPLNDICTSISKNIDEIRLNNPQ